MMSDEQELVMVVQSSDVTITVVVLVGTDQLTR